MPPANTRGRSGPGKGRGVGIGGAGLPGTQHILHGDAQGSAASLPALTGEFNTTADAQKVFLYISDNQQENTSRQGAPRGFLPGLTHLHPVRGRHPGLTQPHEQGMGLPNHKGEACPSQPRRLHPCNPTAHLRTHGGAQNDSQGTSEDPGGRAHLTRHQGDQDGASSTRGPGARRSHCVASAVPVLTWATSPPCWCPDVARLGPASAHSETLSLSDSGDTSL